MHTQGDQYSHPDDPSAALQRPPARRGSNNSALFKVVGAFLVLSIVFFAFAGGMLVQRFVVGPPADNAQAANGDGPEAFNAAWELVHDKYVDQKAINDPQMVESAIDAMLGTLHDEGHTRYMTPQETAAENESLSGEYVGVGIHVQETDEGIVVIAPIDGSPAMEAGVRPGDLLLSVDGEDVTGQGVDVVVDKIRGEVGTQVTLTFRRKDEAQPLSFTMTRQEITVSPVASVMLDNNIALIRLSQFSSGAGDAVVKALKEAQDAGATSVILDLRNNPGGYINEAIQVGSAFVPKDSTIFVSQYRDGSQEDHKAEPQAANIGDMPLIVLVNEGSASSSEIVSGAIKSNNPHATIIGETTFGTGTVLSSYNLPNGATILLGTELWLTPEGKLIKNHGIRPDVIVALQEGQFPYIPIDNAGPPPADLGDYQLEWAISVLQSETTSASTTGTSAALPAAAGD
jgi:carboxyl-terminal processing protease